MKVRVVKTDSNYVCFPHLANAPASEIWDYSEYVAKEVTKLFPKAIKLEFEEVIYWRFFILTKKRYMSLACYRDGVVSDDIKKKGVLLARRDNCKFIRDIYAAVILKIFHKEDRDDVIYFILTELNKLCSGFYNHKEFSMTQRINSTGKLFEITPREFDSKEKQLFLDEKGKKKMKLGHYKVEPLPLDEKAYEKKMTLKNAATEQEYYLRCLPAQVQLGEKMKRRGQLVSAGQRLEYVVTTEGGHTAKKYMKIEASDYFHKHSNVLKVDYLYYLKQLTNHLDQVLDVVYATDNEENRKYKYKFKPKFVNEQYKYRVRIRGKILEQIRNIGKPKIVFSDK